MSFPEISAFARNLEGTAPDDHDEHVLNFDRAQELIKFLEERDSPEHKICLEAASRLIEILLGSSMQDSRTEILASACQAVRAVERELESESCIPSTAEEPNAGQTVGVTTQQEKPHKEEASSAPSQKVITHRATKPSPASASADEIEEDLPKIHEMVLGKLLIELKQASRKQVASALKLHRSTKLPVGECLLVNGVSPDHLLSTLKLQRDLRATPPDEATRRAKEVEKKLRREQAELALAYGVETKAEVKKREAGMRVTEAMFLGEVILGAGLITNDQLGQAMNVHHLEGLRVGEALIRIGAISETELKIGLELHQKLRSAVGLGA